MQYRIEGVEVFTPNHYNDMWNAGFGLVSGLNANVIGNSDFFTSTFNANYSNALSGVFDVKMRPGNNAKHENILQLGSAFEELTLEGPLSKKSNASYIVNYRYGFTSLVDKLGLVDTDGEHLAFQDFSWKLNLPTRSAGTFSVFGLALLDKTHDERMALEDTHSAYDASNNDGDMTQLLAGIIDDNPIYKDNEAFSQRFDPTSIVDMTVSYKINKRRVSHTIAFEGLNILGAKAPQYQRFDLGTNDVRTDKAGISLPNIFYRLDF